jgi:hypothetical protein
MAARCASALRGVVLPLDAVLRAAVLGRSSGGAVRRSVSSGGVTRWAHVACAAPLQPPPLRLAACTGSPYVG